MGVLEKRSASCYNITDRLAHHIGVNEPLS